MTIIMEVFSGQNTQKREHQCNLAQIREKADIFRTNRLLAMGFDFVTLLLPTCFINDVLPMTFWLTTTRRSLLDFPFVAAAFALCGLFYFPARVWANQVPVGLRGVFFSVTFGRKNLALGFSLVTAIHFCQKTDITDSIAICRTMI